MPCQPGPTLTPQQVAVIQQKLAEATAAQHSLAIGQGVHHVRYHKG